MSQRATDSSEQAEGAMAAEEIFLTPRVIDRRAFERYSSQLRASLEETSRESDLIARRAEAAAVVLERLERFVGSHADVFDRASQLIESIDDRQSSTGELLDRVTRQTEAATKAVREIESVARERGEAFEQRLITLATDALDRFEFARDELSGQAATMRRDLIERLDQIRDKGESVVAELETRAERSASSISSLLREIDGQREVSREREREMAKELDERAHALRDEIVTAGSGIKRELDGAARSLREAIAAGSAHRDTIERAAETAVGRAMSGVSDQTLELERLARRAEGIVREHKETIESLERELDARSTSLADRFQQTIDQRLEKAIRRADEKHERLSSALETANQLLSEGELDRAAEDALEVKRELAEAVRTLEENAGRAITDGEEARHSLIRAAEDVRGQSMRLIQTAREAASDSTPALERLTKSIEAATRLTEKLDAEAGELDARVERHVNVVMDDRTLALGEQIQILQDRLERAEHREGVLRDLVESQNADMSTMRRALEELQRARTDTSERSASNSINEDDPELLVPVVVAKAPSTGRKKATTRKKATAKKAAPKKAAAKKAGAKKAAARKASTKKAASKATKKKTTRKSTAKKAASKSVQKTRPESAGEGEEASRSIPSAQREQPEKTTVEAAQAVA